MLSKEGLDFLLKITDYFHGHYEDPEWGKRPTNQVLVLLSVHTLANGIADGAARQVIQSTIEKAMTEAAREAMKMSTQDPIPPRQKK